MIPRAGVLQNKTVEQTKLKSNRFDANPILCDIDMKNCQEGKAT